MRILFFSFIFVVPLDFIKEKYWTDRIFRNIFLFCNFIVMCVSSTVLTLYIYTYERSMLEKHVTSENEGKKNQFVEIRSQTYTL